MFSLSSSLNCYYSLITNESYKLQLMSKMLRSIHPHITKAEFKSITNLSKNVQTNRVRNSPLPCYQYSSISIKDNLLLTNGNISGRFKRFRSFSTLNKPDAFRNYHQVNQTDIAFFTELLGKNNVITDREDCVFASTDWFRRYIGNASCILTPDSTEKVSQI